MITFKCARRSNEISMKWKWVYVSLEENAFHVKLCSCKLCSMNAERAASCCWWRFWRLIKVMLKQQVGCEIKDIAFLLCVKSGHQIVNKILNSLYLFSFGHVLSFYNNFI